MTSWHGNTFHILSICLGYPPVTNGFSAQIKWNFDVFIVVNLKKSVKQTVKLPVIWNTSLDAHVDGLVQYCMISIANALEILQSCTKSSMWCYCNGMVSSVHQYPRQVWRKCLSVRPTLILLMAWQHHIFLHWQVQCWPCSYHVYIGDQGPVSI